MAKWFPAVGAALSEHGLHMPSPYPNTARALLGSALAAVVTAIFIGIGYLFFSLYTVAANFAEDFYSTENKAKNSVAIAEKKEGATSFPSILPADASLKEIHTRLDRSELPFSELKNASFSDEVRKLDFALVQTLLRLGIDSRRVVSLGSEMRQHGNDMYQYQRMRILLPPLPERKENTENIGSEKAPQRVVVNAVAEFVGTLEENMDAWAGQASMNEQAGKIALSINSVVTHEIWIDAAGRDFFPSNSGTSKARLVIVIGANGEKNSPQTIKSLLDLPVVFAISPEYAQSRETAEMAWKAGHEILVFQPMQSSQAPYIKAGASEITTDMSDEDIAAVLGEVNRKVPHATGMTNYMGSGLCSNREVSERVIDKISAAGLYWLDLQVKSESWLYKAAVQRKIPAWKRDMFLDEGNPSVSRVVLNLKKAEQLAQKNGQAIVFGQLYPETAEAIRRWSDEKNTDVVLVPLCALQR